jgi:hypothetical protein
MGQDWVDSPGAKGERLGGLDAWRGQAEACMWGFQRFTRKLLGSSVAPQSRARRFVGLATKPHRARTTWWPSYEWDWRGGCTESAGFAAVHHKIVRVTWLSYKTKYGGSTGVDG